VRAQCDSRGIALALLAHDEWIPGFILVVPALVYAVRLLMTVEREPDAPLAYQALAVAARAQLRARLACVSVAAWSRALRALMRVRRRQQRLYAARKDRLAAFGEAILRGDRAHAARLKAETRDLGEEIMQARDHEASVAISSAREQIERERAAGQADAARGLGGGAARPRSYFDGGSMQMTGALCRRSQAVAEATRSGASAVLQATTWSSIVPRAAML